VDESGSQIAVFGRVGAGPLTLEEQHKMYMHNGQVWRVSDDPFDDEIYRWLPRDEPATRVDVNTAAGLFDYYEDGRPVGGLRLAVVIRANQQTFAEAWFGFLEGAITDEDGRFQIPGVIPGMNVSLATALAGGSITGFLIPETSLRPGESKDFGELKLKPQE
jgi:hypothetical protein